MNILFTFCLLIIPLLFIGYSIAAIFSAQVRQEIKLRKWAFVFLAVISLVCLFVVVPHGPRVDPKKVVTQYRLNRIRAAILNYETEYSNPPSTANNAPLMKELRASNPKKDVFLTLGRGEHNKKGEAIDAWGTPFRISLDDPNDPLVQSAGPDKKWGTADDMSSKEK